MVLKSFLGRAVTAGVDRLGYHLVRNLSGAFDSLEYPDATDRDRSIYERVRPYTMTSEARVWALIRAVDYLDENEIAGDFVECGVWRGGSAMAMMLACQGDGRQARHVWLYDTFEGMSPPTDLDVEIQSDRSASEILASTPFSEASPMWAYSPRVEVEFNVASTGYPEECVTIAEGDVVATLRSTAPERIALLRLDTDWYESTLAELEVLFPKLVAGGVCIIDDYGHWGGSRRAVDEYFARQSTKPLLSRIDYTGRILIKV